VVRIDIELGDRSEWVKLFDPRDSTIFIAQDDPPRIGEEVRLDLVVGHSGPRVILRGKVIARRVKGDSTLPRGCSVALGAEEREKINYLNGFVRGGLLNLRERRRLPIRLECTYGGIDGPVNSFTRDINEEGVFVISEDPLPEESEIHLLLSFPGRPEPVSLAGVVSHTVVIEDEDVPGMGIRFQFGRDEQAGFVSLIDELEDRFVHGTLPEDCLL
jgi:Tfp pilus assembly protein PilZ